MPIGAFFKKHKKLITCPVKCEAYLTGMDEKCPQGHFSFILYTPEYFESSNQTKSS